jgi:tetratricopeptide (TPR) repeat protein
LIKKKKKNDRAFGIFAQAFALQQEGKLGEAVQAYREVLLLDRNHVPAWNNLAGVLRKLRHFEAAAGCAKRAVDLAPHNYSFLSTYGNALASLDRKAEALAAHAQAARHCHNDFNIRKNYALTLRAFRKYEEALLHFNAACILKPDDPDVQLERAMMYLQLGRYEEGWKDFEVRRRMDWMKCLHLNHLRWDGGDFGDKTVLLCAEQGFGDTILCSRYIPMLKTRGGRVVFVCKKDDFSSPSTGLIG